MACEVHAHPGAPVKKRGWHAHQLELAYIRRTQTSVHGCTGHPVYNMCMVLLVCTYMCAASAPAHVLAGAGASGGEALNSGLWWGWPIAWATTRTAEGRLVRTARAAMGLEAGRAMAAAMMTNLVVVRRGEVGVNEVVCSRMYGGTEE